MIDRVINKFKSIKIRSIAPEVRGPLFIGLIIFTTILVSIFLAYSYLKPDTNVHISTGAVDASSVRAQADAKTSEAYKKAKRMENEESYNRASLREGGVAIPFTFDEEPKGGEEGKNINNCGCTIDEKQLEEAIRNLGLTSSKKLPRDLVRVAKSDIYISTNGQLMNDKGEPLYFRSNFIFMDSTGALLDQNGISYLTKDKEPYYLSSAGELIDRKTQKVPLLGDLRMPSGEIYISDGRLSIRPGNMQRVSDSDIYITSEGQLVTMDGKPIRHSGAFVYLNDEQKLLNRQAMDVAWEQQSVYQNIEGHLVNVSGKTFNQPGILFSYEGIMIDNHGKLTRPLVNIEKIGESDIYKTENNKIVDGYGLPITHYGSEILIGHSNKLLTKSGLAVLNRNGAEVYISDNGSLRVDIGNGGIQSGILKTSENIALDRQAQMITRRGRLERRSLSDIYITSDGLLSDSEGKTIKYKNKDIFLDFSSILNDGSQALETYDRNKVLDKYGNRVYLSLEGKLIDISKNVINETGILTSTDGVALTPFGKNIIDKDKLEQIFTADGLPVLSDGNHVFKDDDGRLYDDIGNPILTTDGLAVFLDDQGKLVDETGRSIEKLNINTSGRNVNNDILVTRKELSNFNGEKLFHNGVEIFSEPNGRIVDANGKAVLTNNGSEIFIHDDGSLRDKNGHMLDEHLITTESGSGISSNIIVGRDKVYTASGQAVKYNNKEIYKGKDGALHDDFGNKITTKDGREIFLDDTGRFVDDAGNLINEELFTVENEHIISNDNLHTRKQLTNSAGNPIQYDGKNVFLSKNGQLLDEDGNPFVTSGGENIFVDSNGDTVNEYGEKLNISSLKSISKEKFTNGKKQSVHQILSSDNNPIFFNGKKLFSDANGKIFDEDGNSIRTSEGRDIYIDPKGNLVDSNGKIVNDIDFMTTSNSKISSGLKKGPESLLMTDGLKSIKQLLASDGSTINYKGRSVFVDDDGHIVDESGVLITTTDGKPMFVDKNGDIVDIDGSIIDENILSIIKPVSLEKGEVTSIQQILDEDGNKVYFNGNEIFQDTKGRIVDENGNFITTPEGKVLFFDENGNIVDDNGNEIPNSFLTDLSGNLIDGQLKLGSQKLVSPKGEKITFSGKSVYKSADGSLVDEFGNQILTPDNKKIFLNDDGDIVDENNVIVNDLFKLQEKSFIKNNIKTGKNKIITNDGHELFYNDKNVFKNTDGFLVDSNGKVILSDNGMRIKIDPNGQLVDENNNLIKNSNFQKKKTEAISSELRTGLDQIILPSGKAVRYKGKTIYKKQDGSVVDDSGVQITTADGRKVYLNSNGELVDVKGNRITESLLVANDQPLTNDVLTTVSSSNMKRVGGSDLFVSRDGILLDGKGKTITFNGEKVVVGEKGQLFDISGNIVTDRNGNSVFVNTQGELVDINGDQIEDSFLENGDGILIGSNGKSVFQSLHQIGNSDLYQTKDGRIVDVNGQGIKFDDKNIYVGDDGRLYYENGKSITDKLGNSVYLDTTTGNLIDRNGNKIDGSILVDSDGTLIDSSGESIISGGKLARLPGTELYKTEDGQVVNSEGKVVKVNGDSVFVDNQNKFVNKYGNAIKFKGKEIFTSEYGRLVDRNGQPISDQDNRSIHLSEKTGFVNDDGELINQTNGKISHSGKLDSPGFRKTVDTTPSNRSMLPPESNTSPIPPKPNTNKPSPPPKPNDFNATAKPTDNNTMDVASIERLQRRYQLIKDNMRSKFTESLKVINKPVKSNYIGIGGKTNLELSEQEEKIVSNGTSEFTAGKDAEKSISEDYIPYKKAGNLLYTVNLYQINSDFKKDIVAEVVGLSPNHPLYQASIVGTFELVYNRLVITASKICPINSNCLPMNGIALDPGTSSAGIASNVDNHYWYRYGGLFVSSLLEGTAEAMTESGTREESTTNTGTKVITTGLDGDKLVLRSSGKVGERFSEAFSNNINRPATVYIDQGEEMAIMLFEDILGPNI